MMKDDDPDAFLNAFEWTATAAGWPEMQWAAVLTPCPISPAQQVVDNLPTCDLGDYKSVRAAIHQTLNLSPEVYHRWLREIKVGPDYITRASLGSASKLPAYEALLPYCHLNPQTGYCATNLARWKRQYILWRCVCPLKPAIILYQKFGNRSKAEGKALTIKLQTEEPNQAQGRHMKRSWKSVQNLLDAV